MSILNIGEPAPEFHLKGIDGKVHSLADLRGVRGSVIIFTELENRYWNQYEEYVIELQQRVREHEIRFTAIFVSQQNDSYSDLIKSMTERAREIGYNFPVILDHLQDIVGDYGSKRIPEAFLLDKSLRLLYRGAIDNRFNAKHDNRSSYLSDALDALLDDREIEIKETEVVGELIQWIEPSG